MRRIPIQNIIIDKTFMSVINSLLQEWDIILYAYRTQSSYSTFTMVCFHTWMKVFTFFVFDQALGSLSYNLSHRGNMSFSNKAYKWACEYVQNNDDIVYVLVVN